MPLLMAMGPVSAQTVDENTAWNGGTISTVGSTQSDFYAQSFIAGVQEIRRFGVVVGESSPEGEVRLAIAEDDSTGRPNVAAPLYTGAMINPTPTSAWFYETDVRIRVTPGKKYYILIDGYQNPGATGNARVGRSNTYTSSGERMIYTNDHGTTWGLVADPIAIYVEGFAAIDVVPTLSSWMLGLLAAALAVAGALRLRS